MNEYLQRSGLAEQPGFMLRLANAAVWSHLRAVLQPLDLRPQSYATLLIIDTSPGCKQQDIADALGIQRPNLVALVDTLVEKQLVVRQVNQDDRRSYALALSPAGKALLTDARRAHQAHEQRLALALGDAPGSAALLSALRQLAAIS